MSEYKVGAKVHVEFDAVIEEGLRNAYDENWDHGKAVQRVRDSAGCVHFVYLYPEIAEVVDTDPENWPPQPGDIWEADGREYVVVVGFDYEGVIFEVNSVGTFNSAQLDEFKALGPVLIRRRSEVDFHLTFGFRTDPQSVAKEVLDSLASSKLT